MSVSYCTRQDLLFIKSDIGNYDRKMTLTNWTTYSGSVRSSANVGQYVGMLYRDGIELGSPQADLNSLDQDGEWFYSEADDRLFLYSINIPTLGHTVEVSWGDVTELQTESIKRASDLVRAYLGKNIMPRKGTFSQDATGDTYEEIIVRSTAMLAVAYLTRNISPEYADDLESRVIDRETQMGLLDRVKRGEIRLWNEPSEGKGNGLVSTVTQNANSTGTIIDTRGTATVAHDIIRVVVSTGGTFEPLVDSPVRITSYVSDDSGSAQVVYASSEVVDGSYIPVGRGISALFSMGVYTQGDTFNIEVNGQFNESGKVRSLQAYR